MSYPLIKIKKLIFRSGQTGGWTCSTVEEGEKEGKFFLKILIRPMATP